MALDGGPDVSIRGVRALVDWIRMQM